MQWDLLRLKHLQMNVQQDMMLEISKTNASLRVCHNVIIYSLNEFNFKSKVEKVKLNCYCCYIVLNSLKPNK
jgi:hypothetical protein